MKTALVRFLIAIALGLATAHAQTTRTWTGASTQNNRWAQADNWSPSGAPVAGDNLVFGDPALRPVANHNLSISNFNSITFTSGGFNVGPQTAGANLVLGPGGMTMLSGVTGFNSYRIRTFLNGPRTVANHAPDSLLIFNPDASYGAPLIAIDNQGHALTVAGVGNIQFASGAAIAGSGGLTKNGSGTLTLLGTNTYRGATTVNEGRLVMSTAHRGGGSIAVASGAVFEAMVDATSSILACSSLTLGTGSSGKVTNDFNLGTVNDLTGPVIYATNLTTAGTVYVNVTGSGAATGQITLIQYEGSIGGDGYTFELRTLPPGRFGHLTNSATSIDLVLTGPPPLTNRPPNLIVIMADDLGYETIGANGGISYQTPHLDRLAGEGVRFTHGYAQPNCTPSRVQIMTGMSNVRNYIDFGTLERSQTTFGHLLRDAGYATCIAGKWQLGSKEADLPKHFGFDEHILWAHMGRGERYADPSLSVNGAELQEFPGDYGPRLCQEFVLDFMRRNQHRPFLVYYPMILTHGPFEATPDSPHWGQPTAKLKEFRQEHFASMVAYMDKQIGELDEELARLGLREHTLILFTGDNGTASAIRSATQGGVVVQGGKGGTTRRGMRVPLIASWPGTIAAGKVCTNLVDLTDFLPTLCEVAEVTPPPELILDGRSFLPQLRGEPGSPREWIYSYWVPLNEDQGDQLGDRGGVEQAFDQRFKLYSTGDFFDLETDPDEQSPLRVRDLTGAALEAADKLQRALDQFKKVHPFQLDTPLAHAQAVGTVQNQSRPIRLSGSEPGGGELTFSVLNPPTNGVLSGSPPLLVYTPAANYHGPDGFTFQAATSQTNSEPARVTITVWPDVDGDGTPDWWMEKYFGNSLGHAGNLSRAGDDADEDGMTNREEWVAGTNPTNGLSNLRITGVTREGNGWRASWTAVGGRSYALEAADAAGSGVGFINVSGWIDIPGFSESMTNFFDPTASLESALRFYRIRVEPRP